MELILENEHGYDRVAKLVEKNYEYYVTIVRNQRVKMTEPCLTTNSDNEKGMCMSLGDTI
jgi:hypothetical protein